MLSPNLSRLSGIKILKCGSRKLMNVQKFITGRNVKSFINPCQIGRISIEWYQGLRNLKFSWSEWQSRLRLALPSDEYYAQLLMDMLACKTLFNDSFEGYFHEKMILINRCKINGKDAIDYVLFCIKDRSIITSAEAAQFFDADK